MYNSLGNVLTKLHELFPCCARVDTIISARDCHRAPVGKHSYKVPVLPVTRGSRGLQLSRSGLICDLQFCVEGTCCSAVHQQATRGLLLCRCIVKESCANPPNPWFSSRTMVTESDLFLEMELIDIEQQILLQF